MGVKNMGSAWLGQARSATVGMPATWEGAEGWVSCTRQGKRQTLWVGSTVSCQADLMLIWGPLGARVPLWCCE